MRQFERSMKGGYYGEKFQFHYTLLLLVGSEWMNGGNRVVLVHKKELLIAALRGVCFCHFTEGN